MNEVSRKDVDRMSCYHPLKGFSIGLTNNQKNKLIITSYDVTYIRYNDRTKKFEKHYDDVYPKSCIKEFIEIPCGKCIGCRLEYSRQWADRCLLEMKDHTESYFLTITYDDEHLPTSSFSRLDTGETDLTSHSLKKRDMQLFMKRLRKAHADRGKLRYFLAGEYGSTTFRPHYHAIIFGLHLDDLKLYRKSSKGFPMYNSEFLDNVWQKGYIVVENCTWETCAYTARYIMKKQNGEESKIYDYYNIEPEFTLMSRNPGIGRNYYDRNLDSIFDMDYINVAMPSGGHKVMPPKYFKRLYAADRPSLSAELSYDSIVTASERQKVKDLMYSNDYLSMLKSEETDLISRTKSLSRDL